MGVVYTFFQAHAFFTFYHPSDDNRRKNSFAAFYPYFTYL